MIDFSSLQIPNYNNVDIKKFADNIIEEFGTELPIEIDLIIEKKFEIDLIPINGLKQISSTDAYLSRNLKEIGFDPEVTNKRIRFSLAHELGHFVMHRDIISSIRINDYTEWKSTLKEIPGWFWGKIEKQANQFAGFLLAPRDLIIQTISDYLSIIREAYKIIPNDIESIQQYLAIPLSKRFLISEEAMRIRLINEGINPYEYI
jgi:Zn-dependent peptidase ImmA (M78 family)